ncbi:MAG: hypothetical protein J6K43_06125 [Lachnospiraceae bacterium]|nr:hypothetical protein [Lachnospiraceae bacterium]
MILYLTDAEHLEELATLREEIHVKQIGNQDMQVLFQQELKHLSTVTHLIVEEAAIRNDTWEAAAASMRVMRNIPVLLIVENEGMTDTFIRKENYDVINRCRRDIQEIVRAWIQQADDMESLNHTWIAVAGLTNGAGTTALSMHLAAHIRKQNQEVSVTERGDVFRCLAMHYGWDELAEDSYQWGGVIYNHNQIDENSPYAVFDLGIADERCYTIWKQCQIKILVVDGKPYRIQGLGARLKQLREFPGEIILAFTFVPDEEKPILKKKYSSDKVRVWFVPVQPDLFITSDAYQDLVQGYVVPVPEAKKKRKIVSFRVPQLPKKISKNKIMAGSIILISVIFGFALATTLEQKQKDNYLEVAVESFPRMNFSGTTRIRLMLAKEQAVTETDIIVEPQTEAATEATTETPASESTERILNTENGLKHLEDYVGTQAPVTEPPATEAPATEEQQTSGVIASLTPSLSGYNGQIYTGSQVIAIMNKFAGQPVAVHLITRSSEGWYNYSVSGNGLIAAASVSSGTSQIDTQCSFLCQVIYVNGEGVGLEFIQQ